MTEAKIPTDTELKERETQLKHKLTPDEIKRQRRGKQLDILEEKKRIRERIEELRHVPTAEEANLQAESDELDVLEEHKKAEQDREQLKRKRQAEARLLNPGRKRERKSLSSLMKGRSL
jgi:hypothetical protein